MTDPYGQAWPRDPGPAQWPVQTPAPWPVQAPAPWPQDGWGAPQGLPPAPPPPPPRTGLRRVHPAILVVAGIVVAAVVVGVLSAVLARGDVDDAPGTGGRSLSIPASVPGLRIVPGVNTDDLKADLGDDIARKGDDPEAVVRHAAVGVFDRGASTDRIVFVGIALRDIPSFRGQVEEDGVRSTLRFFMSGAVDRSGGEAARDFPPGPRGGFMRCQSGTTSGSAVTICGWGDESAFALTIVTGRPSLDVAAGVTRSLRAAIERD